MSSHSNQKSLFVLIFVLILIISGTYIISIFARGYRLDIANNTLEFKATGLLSATSKPKSASVYINGVLTTATDDTINLPPGEYQIKISKDGYLPWSKKILIQKELVYQSDTSLFRAAASPLSIISDEISNPYISPDQNRIIFSLISTSSSSLKKSGLYVLDAYESLLPFTSINPKLLVANTSTLDWSKFTFKFSPNSKQLLATSKNGQLNYLLSLDQNTTINNLKDVTPQLNSIKKEWDTLKSQINQNKINELPPALSQLIATDSAVFSFSSDGKKLLYQASTSGTLASNLITPPQVISTQIQNRELQPQRYYVYDIEEDTNFLIGDTSISPPFWLPNSNQLIFTKANTIFAIEFDGTNLQKLYIGTTNPQNLFCSNDGTKLLFTLKQQLYSLTIKDR